MLKTSEYNKEWVKRNLAEGKCVYCSSQRLENSNRYCEKHHLSSTAKNHLGSSSKWGILKSILENQDYKCALTGDDIILGLNDSLDHKLPKSKLPLDYDHVNNVRYVTRVVNTVKNNLTDEELLKLLEKIKTHLSKYKT